MAGAKPALTALAVGAMIAVLASGCGGGGKQTASSPPTSAATTSTTTTTPAAAPLDKAEYDTRMRAIGRGVSKSLDSINGLTSEATAAKTVAKLQSHLRSTAESLAALTPPAPIKAQHAQLVKAVRDLADELDTVIARLKGGKLDAAAVFATIVGLKGVAEIQSASTAIANRGYSIGSG